MTPAPADMDHLNYEQDGKCSKLLWRASSITRFVCLPLLSVTIAAQGITLPHQQGSVQLNLALVALGAHHWRLSPLAGLRPWLENLCES